MIYLLIGDDIVSKDLKIEEIKNEFKNFDYKGFYIKSKKELKEIINDIEIFLITQSFFLNPKVAKITCEDENIVKEIVTNIANISNENNVAVIYSNKVNKSTIVSLKHIDTLEIIEMKSISDRKEAKKYVIHLINNFGIQISNNNEKEKIIEAILKSAKSIIKNGAYDKKIINNEVDKIRNIAEINKRNINYKDVKDLFIEKFDGNYFYLVDEIFKDENLKNKIESMNSILQLLNIEEIQSFLRILSYTIKEYIKYKEHIVSKKAYLFSKTPYVINEPSKLLAKIGDLSFDLRKGKKTYIEEIDMLIIKYIELK